MRTRIITLVLLLAACAVAVFAGESLTYVYRNGSSTSIQASGELDDILELAERAGSRYGDASIWLKLAGREYVIRDAATLAQAREIHREVDDFSPRMRQAERALRPLEKRMEEIERRLDALSDSLDDDSLSDRERDAIERKLRAVEGEMQTAEREMRPAEEEMERLERDMDAREKRLEQRFEKLLRDAVKSGLAERVH
jgi:chromosome segregation ATPase